MHVGNVSFISQRTRVVASGSGTLTSEQCTKLGAQPYLQIEVTDLSDLRNSGYVKAGPAHMQVVSFQCTEGKLLAVLTVYAYLNSNSAIECDSFSCVVLRPLSIL